MRSLIGSGRGSGRTGLLQTPEGMAIAQVSRDRTHAMPRLLTLNYLETAAEETDRLSRSLDKLDLRKLPCNRVLAGDDYQLLLVEAPDVEPSELRAAVRWRIRDLIDFHIDDAVIDVFDIPGQDQARARMMYVVACRAPVVQRVVDAMEAGPLALEVIDIAELALRNVAALLEEDVEGVALLHLERDYGLITVTRQASLYLARRIDSGYAELHAAMAEDAVAEDAFPGPATRELIGSMVLELQRSLDYYESHLSAAPATSVCINLPPETPAQLISEFESSLSVPVRAL